MALFPVPDMTYNVFGGTLSLTQSINQSWRCSTLSVIPAAVQLPNRKCSQLHGSFRDRKSISIRRRGIRQKQIQYKLITTHTHKNTHTQRMPRHEERSTYVTDLLLCARRTGEEGVSLVWYVRVCVCAKKMKNCLSKTDAT